MSVLLLLLPEVGPSMELRSVGFECDYEKRVVTIDSSGARTESRQMFRLYRDARGRTRMEGSAQGEGGQVVRYAFLTDLARGRAVVVDLDTGNRLKEAPGRATGSESRTSQEAVRGTGSFGRARAKDAGEAQTVEELGDAEIEGLAARGRRITSGSYVVETWTALQIDQPPVLLHQKEAGKEKTERLFNVHLGEPDPTLFSLLDAP